MTVDPTFVYKINDRGASPLVRIAAILTFVTIQIKKGSLEHIVFCVKIKEYIVSEKKRINQIIISLAFSDPKENMRKNTTLLC